MSTDIKPAAFSFETYKVSSFAFNEPKSKEGNFTMAFNPSGTFHSDRSEYDLRFGFVAKESDESEDFVISATLTATFKFSEPIPYELIPGYFYKNSIALVFPYLRAFVSTLLLQANKNIIIIPPLNLSSLEKPLRENTEVK